MGADVDALRRQSALFILKMKEKRLLSQAAVDDIIHVQYLLVRLK